jgi:hypothetical protein
VAAFALNIALYVAFGYIVYTFIPITFEGVRFWPPVIIPAIFAVIFGPMVGGLGAAVGIFLSDMLLGGNPLLSLMAGVTSNFVAFYLIGYIAQKKIRWALPVGIYSAATAFLVWIAYAYSGLNLVGKALFIGVAAACYLLVVVPIVISRNSKLKSFQVGSIVGMLLGAGIIGIMVPVYTQLFAKAATPFTVPVALATFFFTFLTEIPFILILGPPIIWAVYRALPNLKSKEDTREQP